MVGLLMGVITIRPAPAAEKERLSLQERSLINTVARYQVTSDIIVQMKMGSQAATLTMRLQYGFARTIEDVKEDGTVVVEVLLDYVEVEQFTGVLQRPGVEEQGKALLVKQGRALKGKKFRFHVARSGKILKTEGMEELAKAAPDIGLNWIAIGRAYSVLRTNQAVAVGENWKGTDETETPNGPFRIVRRTETRAWLDGIIPWRGRRVGRVAFESKLLLSSRETLAAEARELKGEGTVRGTNLITKSAGIVAGAEVVEDFQLTVRFGKQTARQQVHSRTEALLTDYR